VEVAPDTNVMTYDARGFSLVQSVQTGSGAHPAFHSIGSRRSPLEAKQTGVKLRLYPYNIKVKNTCTCIRPLPHISARCSA